MAKNNHNRGRNMNPKVIQEDLRNGNSIDETLKKHNTNLMQVFKKLHGYHKNSNKTRPVTPSHYIQQQGDTFAVRKSVNGKTKLFGMYDSLEDAIKVREALKDDGWHQRHVDRICEELGIVRRKSPCRRNRVRYS